MGFDASEISEMFEYTLKGGIKGHIPEPTNAEIEKFREGTYGEQLKACGLTNEQVEAEGGSELFDKALAALTYEQRKELAESMLEATIEFCNGSPTREQILEMPALTQLAFIQNVRRVLNPLL